MSSRMKKMIRKITIHNDSKGQKELEQSVNYLRTILDAIASGITFSNDKGKFDFYNTEMERMSGYTIKEANSKRNFYKILFPDARERVNFLKQMDTLYRAGRVKELEATLKRKDGKILNVLIHTSLVNFQKRKLILNTYLNISNRAKAERELRDSEAKYRLLAENIKDVIWTLDMKMRFTYMSPSVKRLLGYKVTDIMKLPLYKVLTPESMKIVLLALKEELLLEVKGPKDWSRIRALDIDQVCKNGSVVSTEVKASFLRDKNKRPIGILGVSTDISERKRSELQLRTAYAELQEAQWQILQSEKLGAVGRLASGVAHEVKNPLAIIMQCINYLEKRIEHKDKFFDTLKMAKDNVLRADDIIRALIDFSRPKELEMKRVNINDVIRKSLVLVQHRIELENIKIIKKLKANISKVSVDRGSLEQVFINIFLNSIQAMPEGGKLIIKTYETLAEKMGNGVGRRNSDNISLNERVVAIEIEDTGSGMHSDLVRSAFDPFFTTKKARQGTGLGLSVCQNIINMHTGCIGIESAEDKGTKITIFLKKQ